MFRAVATVRGALVVALLVLPVTVLADARTEARRHFRRGMELVVEGNVDGGVAELELAYEILPHPNVLYNIARAYAENGRYDDALEYFERYLASDPPDREEVRQVLAAIEQRIAARDALAQQQTGTTTNTNTGVSETTGTGISASRDEIQALRDAATQIATLAEVSQSDTLRQRAERLMELANALERGTSATTGEPTTNTGTTEPTTGETPEDGADALAIGTAGGATYEEEVVTSSRFAQSPLDAPSSTTIITRQDIRLSGITHLGELLRRVAGVQVMTTSPGDTNVAIRGFNRMVAPRVVMLINGRSTYFDALGAVFWGQQPIDVEDVERVEIIRGPASALYGANSFSGIVNIITRTPGEEPGTEVAVGYGNGDTARAHVSTTGRSGNFSYRFNSGYMQTDRYSIPFSATARQDLTYPVSSPDIGNQVVNVRGDLRYRISENARLSVEGGMVYSAQLSLFGTASITDVYARGPNSYAMISAQTRNLNARVFWNRYSYDVVQADQVVRPFTIDGDTIDGEIDFAPEFDTGSVHHNLHVGGGYRLKTIDWTLLDRQHTQHHFAFFAEDTMRVSEALRLVAGFRLDRTPVVHFPIFSPRVAIVIRPTDGQAFRITSTSAFRTPSFAESYLQTVFTSPVSAVGALGFGAEQASDIRNAPRLAPERIVTAEIGYQNQESDYFILDIAAFYNRVWDTMSIGVETESFTLADYADPTLSNLATFDRTANQFVFGPSSITNPSDKYNIYGAELSLRVFPVDGLDVWMNYSLNLNYIVDPARAGDSRDYRQSVHTFNGGVQYRASIARSRLNLGLDFHTASFTEWPEPITTSSGLVLEQFRQPWYYMMNGRIAYVFPDDRVEIGISGFNITNQKIKIHPFAQTLTARFMGTLSARF